MSAQRRDTTVGELRRMLANYPDHQPVVPVVNGVVGVMTGVREKTTLSDGTLLLVGEADLPMDLIEANRESVEKPSCNWPRCRSPKMGKCFAWCKCRCHSVTKAAR